MDKNFELISGISDYDIFKTKAIIAEISLHIILWTLYDLEILLH